MTTGMQFRRIAPLFTATKWTKLGDHPEVFQPDPLGGGILATPRGLEHVSIGDWILEGGPEVKQVVPAMVFEEHYEPRSVHSDDFKRWQLTREIHPNEIGVDHGRIGAHFRHHFGGRAHMRDQVLDDGTIVAHVEPEPEVPAKVEDNVVDSGDITTMDSADNTSTGSSAAFEGGEGNTASGTQSTAGGAGAAQ